MVAAAVIDTAGRVLIAQRPAGKPLAGGWEFPGGKLEPGESRTSGLARELREELGIDIRDPRPLMRVRHTYAHGDVLIDMWVVTHYASTPCAMDGQALRWCDHEQLEAAELLPADRPLVRSLRLPERMTRASTDQFVVLSEMPGELRQDRPDVVAPGKLLGVRCASAQIARCAAIAGADFVLLNCNESDRDTVELCAALTIPVFVRAATPEQAFILGASGTNELDHRT